MVQSGLNDSDVYVSPIRLAAHFIAAMVLIGYALVVGLTLTVDQRNRIVQPELRMWALLITCLIVVQLIFGAFMAGLKAANVAPTWPDINGMIVPDSIGTQGSFLKDLFHNKISIHFIHRTLAYIILVAIAIWWFKAKNIIYSRPFNKARNGTLLLVILQVTLGVLTVISSTKITMGKFGQFEWLALAHQLIGMLLLLAMVAVLYITKRRAA